MTTTDEAVTAAFWQALEPAEFDRYDAALAAFAQDHSQLERARRRQLERLRYNARLAEKQYRLVDPENRLVAAELVRRWNAALEAVQEATEDLARRQANPEPISAELRRQVQDVRNSLPQLWAAGALPNDRKKIILRTLIDKVILHRVRPDRLLIRIVWMGGASTILERSLPVVSYADLFQNKDLTAELLRRTRAGQSDGRIAREMTAAGFHSPRGGPLKRFAVGEIRRLHGVDSPQTVLRRDGCPGWLTIIQVAERLAEHSSWILHCIRRKRIRMAKDAYYGVFLFPETTRVLREIKEVLRSKRLFVTIEPRVSR